MKQSQSIEMMIEMFKHKILKKNRVYVLAAMVILIATASGVANCLDEVKIFKLLGGTDDITVFENSFQPVRGKLPPFSVIGYYSDKKYDARTFFMTIYTLSPRIVVREIEHPFVIGSFSRFTNPDEFAKANNLSIMETVDKSIVLFKKGSK